MDRRIYAGVDQLLLAAMIHGDSSKQAPAAAHSHHNPSSHPPPPHQPQQSHHHQQQPAQHLPAATGYLPSGRGIGYPVSARETYAQIPTPSNKSELELYLLLERANLLNYFGTFLNFGGDDVQQLSDADEDEFIEIMGLVGMTHKPLHVRRLQKALIEWRNNKESDIQRFTGFQINNHNISSSNNSNREHFNSAFTRPFHSYPRPTLLPPKHLSKRQSGTSTADHSFEQLPLSPSSDRADCDDDEDRDYIEDFETEEEEEDEDDDKSIEVMDNLQSEPQQPTSEKKDEAVNLEVEKEEPKQPQQQPDIQMEEEGHANN